jgi:hypothetical protein
MTGAALWATGSGPPPLDTPHDTPKSRRIQEATLLQDWLPSRASFNGCRWQIDGGLMALRTGGKLERVGRAVSAGGHRVLRRPP